MSNTQLNNNIYESIRNSNNWIEFHNNIISCNETNLNVFEESDLESLDSDSDYESNTINYNTPTLQIRERPSVSETLDEIINSVNQAHIRRPINNNYNNVRHQIQYILNNLEDTIDNNMINNSNNIRNILDESFEESLENNITVDEDEYNNKIKNLKTIKVTNEVNCSICLDVIKKDTTIYNLKCNHKFHIDCMNEWLHEKLSCPICRVDI